MKTRRGKVEEIEDQGNRWRMPIDGFWMSLYKKEVSGGLDLEEGDEVQVKWVREEGSSGTEDVIKEWKLQKSPSNQSLGKEERMDRGVALKAAARVSDNPEEAEKVAKRWYRLLRRGDWNE